jgi:hypothetical protein
MRPKKSCFLRALLPGLALLLLASPANALAEDELSTYPGSIQAPANIAIAGGGLMSQGHALTVYNASYRSKYESLAGEDQKNNRNIDNTTFMNLLKLRYAATDRLELQATVPYVFNDPMAGRTQDSWGDASAGVMYGFLQERLGDPVDIAAGVRAVMPTGSMGPSALPGGGAWGAQFLFGVTKTLGRFQIIHDLWLTAPMEEGNAHLRKGDNFGATYRYAYALTKNLGVGLEGVIEHTDRGKRLGIELKNDMTEWYTGPALTFSVPGTNLTLAVGTYLPVYRSYGQNTSSDSVRFDGKIAYFW